jgi:hypothetical protein
MKVDSVGVLEWRRRFAFGFNSISQTLDGNYILGVSASFSGVSGAGIVKLDGAGNVMWAKGFNSPQSTADAIIETPDGGYLAVGDAATNNFILLLKVDAAGRMPGCTLLTDLSSATQATSTAQITPPATVAAAAVEVDDVSVLPLAVSLIESILCDFVTMNPAG